MNIHDLNNMDQRMLRDLLYESSGCNGWSKMMLTHFPVEDLVDLLENAEEVWYECSEDEWKEAFARNSAAVDSYPQNSSEFSNSLKAYQEKFDYPFILDVNGRSMDDISENLVSRLQNAPQAEIRVAADEQMKQIRKRIEKLMD